jgi:hypothetical protein
MPDKDLTRLDEWFGRILKGLSPADRRRAALKLGQALRRSNLKRIAANIDPDGTPSPHARPATTARAACAPKPGARCSRACATPSTGASTPTKTAWNSPRLPVTARMAAVSQFGETVTVGRLRNGTKIRARYPERRLLGFSEEDEGLALEIAAAMIEAN